MPDNLESLESIERRKEYLNLLVELKEFIAKQNQIQANTTEWRDNMNKQISTIIDRLGNLPCKTRETIYDSLNSKIVWLWVMISGIILAIIGDFVKNK